MSGKKILIAVLIIFSAVFIAHTLIAGGAVYGDGKYYYSQVRSAVVDHDLEFANDYSLLKLPQTLTPTGRIGNKFAIGPAILWIPAFIYAHSIFNGLGTELFYQTAVGLISVLYVFTGIVLMYLLLTKYFSKTSIILTIITLTLTTNLFFYGSVDPINSHSLAFFASSLFLCLLFYPSKKTWIAIGASLGLIALIRPQNAVLGIILLPYLTKKNIFPIAIGALAVFAPQLAIWKYLYGKFITNPYFLAGEGFNFSSPNILGVLFAPANGLLLWTPSVLLGFIGYFVLRNKYLKKFQKIFIVTAGAQIYLISSWHVWWQGASYSTRMLVGTLPTLAIGMAGFYSLFNLKNKTIRITLFFLIGSLSIINSFLIIKFLLLEN